MEPAFPRRPCRAFQDPAAGIRALWCLVQRVGAPSPDLPPRRPSPRSSYPARSLIVRSAAGWRVAVRSPLPTTFDCDVHHSRNVEECIKGLGRQGGGMGLVASGPVRIIDHQKILFPILFPSIWCFSPAFWLFFHRNGWNLADFFLVSGETGWWLPMALTVFPVPVSTLSRSSSHVLIPLPLILFGSFGVSAIG